jgi:hypothetical protein
MVLIACGCQIKQALSGLLSRPEAAVMVRFDAFYEQKLDPQKRTELIDAIKALSQKILIRRIYEKANGGSYKNRISYGHVIQCCKR